MRRRKHGDPYSETDRPRDLDELRHRLNRRMANMIGQWRHCPAAACRRTHRCLSRVEMCTTAGQPPVEMTQEESARMMAELGRDVRQRLEALQSHPERQDVEEEAPRSAPDRTRKPGRSSHRNKAGGAP